MGPETSELFLNRVRCQLLERRVLIRHVGCAHPDHPPTRSTYTYTIGLAAHGHAELLIAGAALAEASPILMDLGQQVTGRTAWFRPGDVIDGLLEAGYPMMIAGPVTPDALERYPVTISAALFDDAGPPMQVVYTDTGYRYPWDDGYDMDDMTQPLLAPVPEVIRR